MLAVINPFFTVALAISASFALVASATLFLFSPLLAFSLLAFSLAVFMVSPVIVPFMPTRNTCKHSASRLHQALGKSGRGLKSIFLVTRLRLSTRLFTKFSIGWLFNGRLFNGRLSIDRLTIGRLSIDRLLKAAPRPLKTPVRRMNPSRRLAALLCIALGLAGCQTSSTQIENSTAEGTLAAAERLLDYAESTSGAEQWELRLSAIELLIDLKEFGRAESEAMQLPAGQNLPANLFLRANLSRARLALAVNDSTRARALLAELSIEQLELLGIEARVTATLGLATAETQLSNAERAVAFLLSPPLAEAAAENLTPFALQRLNEQTWHTLNALDLTQLARLASASESYHSRGWIELNRAVRREGFSLRGQLDAIARWQRVWAQHPANSAMPRELLGLARAWDERPRHIALALPLQLAAGRALQEGFTAAYYQALAISREVPRISLIDSSGSDDVRELVSAALASGADFMIGPLNKDLVNQLAELPSLPLPTLALNYAEAGNQESKSLPSELAQFGLAPEDEIDQLVTLARERGLSRAAVIVPEGESYARLQDEFRIRWNEVGGQVVAEERLRLDEDYTEVTKRLLAIDASESRARKLRATLPRNNIEFIPQRRGDIDFAFLISPASQARQLVPTLAFYYAQDLPLIALPSIFDGAQDAGSRDLDGLVFKDAPWMLEAGALRNEADAHLAPALGASQRLRAMGVDSFYLAMQLQQLREDPQRELAGVTGTLSIDPTGRVNRNLLTARFENGLPVITD